MDTKNKDEIRQAVRDSYGNIARAETNISEISTKSCCGGNSDFSVEKLSTAIGYSKKDIDSVPEGANLGLGCGNPVALGSLKTGETVVDLGSGGGFDCFLASREVGESGHVIGVDMTPDMISKDRKNAEKMEQKNVEFRLGEIEHLPVADNSADIIMSNCVINLSPDKSAVYRDIFRVLKPGGRLAISDIAATSPLPNEIQKDLALVSACIGGAATLEDIEKMLRQAGFQDVKISPKNVSKETISEWIPGKNLENYVVSVDIEAVKPSQ